jgi:hypothetical protein
VQVGGVTPVRVALSKRMHARKVSRAFRIGLLCALATTIALAVGISAVFANTGASDGDGRVTVRVSVSSHLPTKVQKTSTSDALAEENPDYPVGLLSRRRLGTTLLPANRRMRWLGVARVFFCLFRHLSARRKIQS